MPLKTERRTQLRKRPLSLVYVELPPSNGGMMRDLSEQGFSLRAMMPLRPSEKIPFSFALDTSARIDGEAIVLRAEDGGHVVALEFAGLPSHSRDHIRRWLDKFDEPLSPETAPAEPAASKHSSLTELRAQIRAPMQPSSAPPAAESASPQQPTPPPNVAPPSRPEPPAMSLPTEVEDTPALPPKVATTPTPEPPPASVSPIAEDTPPLPPRVDTPPIPPPPLPLVAERPQKVPWHTVMALPKPAPPHPQEAPPPPPAARPTLEQREASPLPPLLKLSSVRPGPPPAETSVEPVAPVAIPKPVAEPPAKIQVSLPKLETPAATEKRAPEPVPAPPVAPRRVLPPALEPLSSFEGETDSDTPGWMDSFTLGRAIGIMLFLTLVAGSYVYHREVGQALIWLGHEIAGEDSSEGSKIKQPAVPSATHSIPEPTPSPSASAVPPPPLTIQQSPTSNEPRSANLPPASDKTPSPQVKDTTPGSLVPLNQVTRTPSPAPSADNSVETGQQEYLQALQILRSPSRTSEIPAAVRLLWAAVEKGNTDAEIALAELFRTGKGVAKNCDQTRILLSAATRKGSAEARKQLEAFQREGCKN